MTTKDALSLLRAPYRRPTRSFFPPAERANAMGIVAAGADPHPLLLVDAYSHGIFPWPHDGMPLLWFSPDPRFVLDPRAAHVPRSLRKTLKKTRFSVRADTRFVDVIEGCRAAPRVGQRGTWITDEMVSGYTTLHEAGLAHSIECIDGDGALVGGFYGVMLGRAFFGESMFARAPDASKIAFATFIAQALRFDLAFIDCQSPTEHLARFGATEWPRARFLAALDTALDGPTLQGPLTLDVGPRDAAEILAAERRDDDG